MIKGNMSFKEMFEGCHRVRNVGNEEHNRGSNNCHTRNNVHVTLPDNNDMKNSDAVSSMDSQLV